MIDYCVRWPLLQERNAVLAAQLRELERTDRTRTAMALEIAELKQVQALRNLCSMPIVGCNL